MIYQQLMFRQDVLVILDNMISKKEIYKATYKLKIKKQFAVSSEDADLKKQIASVMRWTYHLALNDLLRELKIIPSTRLTNEVRLMKE